LKKVDPIDFSVSSLSQAIIFRNQARDQKKTFVLTNGCFDLLHSGHIYSLNKARELGDYLWVALNSDSSVRQLKGSSRPIIGQNDRAYMLSNLSCVSGVIIFDSKRLDKEILALKPDIYVKAGDYDQSNIAREEHDALIAVKTVIEFVSFLPGRSTSALIQNIHSKFK
jgi:rfaE bifunctional protein nucleotidyltransferase chain/domain